MRYPVQRISLKLASRFNVGTRRGLYNATALKTGDVDLSWTTQSTDTAEVVPNDARIIVIGAGLAGLSAANHLIKHGFHRTMVLEATDRCGGRVNSKRFGDTFCELGAKWVNIDGSHDSMYELLSNASGLKKQIKQPGRIAYVHQQGRAVNPKMAALIDEMFRHLCRGFKVAEKVRSGNDLQELDNVMAYFKAESNKLITRTFNKQDQVIACDIFNTLFKEFGSVLGCCLEYVNIEHINKLPAPLQSEPQAIYVPTGLDNVLHRITDNIKPKRLQTGKPVGKIQWQSTSVNGVHTLLGAAPGSLLIEPQCVSCLDGSVYTADHIICTLPLGVLKNFANILFKPTLPKEKLDAIEKLGFGNPVRIYLEYKRPIRQWLTVNLRPLSSALPKKRERAWTQQVVEIAPVPSSNRVIEIQVGGGFYEEIEKLPDAKVLEEITELLRQCLGNENVPYPSSLLRSNWSSSACYFGGRPYFTTDSTTRDVQRLAHPLGNVVPTLLFAGDATIVDGFGTIDGARASGIREAQRIIDHYQRESLE